MVFIFCNSNTSAYFQDDHKDLHYLRYQKTMMIFINLVNYYFLKIFEGQKFGQRSTDSIIYDNYLNPKIDTLFLMKKY